MMSAKLHIFCRKASLVAVFLLFLQPLFSQKKAPPPPALPVVEKLIEERKAEFGNDFSVLVAVADSMVYQKNTGDAANLKTPSSIGASSQWLTAALIMQLADEGKFSLDDPVSKYLPEFELYRRNFVTIRHCLTHQTGLTRDSFNSSDFLKKSGHESLEEETASFLKNEIHANAGEAFRYTAYGPVTLARLAEAVTKKKFDQLIRAKLFVPLTMRNTTFATDNGSAPNPAGGAKSTAADFIKFLQMLLGKGKWNGKQILSETAVAEMRKIQVDASRTGTVPKADERLSFALGCWAEGVQGVNTSVLLLPGLSGTWPVVDFSRGYAMLVFARNFSGEQQPVMYSALKNIVDTQFATRNNQ